VTLSRLRVPLSLVGLALALIAVLLDNRIVTWVAIGVLALAFSLRFVDRRTNPPVEPPAE
jgi:hypothetical protein